MLRNIHSAVGSATAVKPKRLRQDREKNPSSRPLKGDLVVTHNVIQSIKCIKSSIIKDLWNSNRVAMDVQNVYSNETIPDELAAVS